MKKGVVLDLILTNMEGLTGDVKIKGSLGYTGHEMVFMILRSGRRVKSMLRMLEFRPQALTPSKICLEKSHGIKP